MNKITNFRASTPIKGIRVALSAFLLVCFLLSASVGRAQESQAIWKKQLESLKKDGHKDCPGDLSQLKLLKYTYKGEIKSEKEKSRVIESYYADEAPVASVLSKLSVSDTTRTATDVTICKKTYPMFEIQTIRQLVDAGTLTEESIATIKQQLNNYVEIGFGRIELVWNYKGKKFRSQGIISNDGMILDPITGSLFTTSGTSKESIRPVSERK